MELAGKTIVITGASTGIGAALALALARHGARLMLAARDGVGLAKVADQCAQVGARAVIQVTDVAQHADCRKLIERTFAEFGGLDVLVNNAGMTMWTRFDALNDLAVYAQLMNVNYLGAVYTTHCALPYLKKTHGLIVAIASVAGFTGVPERTGYAASKHALVGFFESLRIELAGSGVDISIIAPDFVVSEIHKRAIGADGKPLGASPMQNSRIMSAEACAARIVRAIEKRERLVVMSLRGRLGRWLKLLAPKVIDGIAARAIRRHY
jgi:short-subunit dehydrogenase